MIQLIRSIQNAKTAHISDPMEKQRLAEYLVSEYIATCLDLPSSKVDHPKMFFHDRHMDVACKKIAQANEHMVLDFDQTLEVVYNLWLARYLLVFEPTDRRVENVMRVLMVANGSLIPGKYREVLEKHDNCKLKSWDKPEDGEGE